MSYRNPDVAFNGLFSSSSDGTDGVITTTTENQLIPCKNAAGDEVNGGTIAVEFLTDCEFNFDDTEGYHFFKSGDRIDMSRTSFSGLRIKTSGSQLRFWGLII